MARLIGIVGATGFIGSYLSRYLAANTPGSIRLLTRSAQVSPDPERFPVITGDLLSAADCRRFVVGLDVIYYLAHTNSPVNSDRDKVSDTMCNLIPLLNLIRAVEDMGTRPQIVYFSSGGSIYAPKHGRDRYCETDPCGPASSYGIQKLVAEQYLRLAAERGHLTATVLRVGNAFGALLPYHRSQGLIGVAVNNVLHGRPVRVFGNPHNVRDYVHLQDICSIAERAAEPHAPFMILNVGRGEGHSVLEILTMIEACYGSPLAIETDDHLGQQLIDWVVLDTSLAQREYGWSPAIDLRSGISDLMADCKPDARACVAK
ncbi:MAG TPA: NAD-dependent epimerase/dehydratase family protein [Candidatus Acidoferrales bacterium]|jgi:UDP-glucose 4-epimerase|nr:NAD-dependent epimerase/dehydratase family protein [Candidatus Acidoferrales bacterium]